MDAFRSFDFDGNPGWQQYKSNLEIPAGKDVETALLRFKARWYQREVDPDFDVSSVKSSIPQHEQHTHSVPEPRSSEPSQFPANGHKPRSTPASQQTQSTSKGGILGRLSNFFSMAPEDRLFFLHILLIIFAVLHVQPFIRSPQTWSRFLMTAALTHGFKVYQRCGLPQVWPFNLEALRGWLRNASPTTDFQYLMLALVFIPSKPLLLVMVPFVTLGVYHAAAYGARHYSQKPFWQKYCTKPYQWLVQRQQQALAINAAAEIGTGFLVILALLAPPRNIFLIFIHWQWLRMRYWTADSANHHRMVWSQLNQSVGKYLDMLPILKMPIGYVQRWFESAQTMQPR